MPQRQGPWSFLHSAREVISGAGCLSRAAELARRNGCSRPALVLDPFFLGGPVEAQLRRELADATGHEAPPSHAVPAHEPDLMAVEAVRAFLEDADPDFVLVVGGGSAMDAAKTARMLLSNPGPPERIAGPQGVRMTPHRSLFVAAPTTAGTGSEVSESTVVANPGADYKVIFRSPEMTPHVALLDPLLGVSAPASVTAASGYDAVTHAVEAYVSNWANPVTDMLAERAMRLLADALPRAYATPGDLAARQDCLVGSMLAAMAFNSANLGLAHAIAGALGALHHVPHGLGNALALPWTMAFNQPALGPKGDTIAAIFDGRTAAGALSRLRHGLGLDRSLDEYVRTNSELDTAAAGAARSGQVRMNPRPASVTEIRAILEAMRGATGGEQPSFAPRV